LEYCPEKMVGLDNITEMIDSPRDRIKKPDHFLASAPAEESFVQMTFVHAIQGARIGLS
jgi:hypothetical protein